MGSTTPTQLHSEPPVSECAEPIAIVGMGCRWPGDSESPSELWSFLQEKRHAYSKFPSDRLTVESFYHPDSSRPGSFYTEGGCFIKSRVQDFDNAFFGIHPREVASLDPAQRKLLEVVYEAFESAGVSMERLAGSKTGCFVGNFNYDHQLMQYRDPEYSPPYAVTGGGITVLSNRINYVFDLKGPSMTLDTACSSSMYALHMACSAIASGDCVGAVVGGSNLILTPECQLFSSVLGAVSPTSVCHTFDASADGYARADGIGALYIKKLSEAVKDRDPIRAVIRGTAVNANGRTGGITHPSPDGQEAVIRRAYERAGGLDPSLTGYFECHGTGTAVGDPLEVNAIGRIFANGRSSLQPLHIGSIKSNLGHSEPSSGIAGIMKAVLAIENGMIPPTIGIKKLNPNIDFKDGKLRVVTESTPWPNLPLRRASVNSFGYGGANAHAILESVDSVLPGYRKATQADSKTDLLKDHLNNGYRNGNSNGYSIGHNSTRTWYLLPFSAHDEKTLHGNISNLAQAPFTWDLGDVAYTLSARRSVLSHRAFSVAEKSSVQECIEGAHTTAVKKLGLSVPTVAFIFTGQGAQWPQMGLALMEEFPTFLDTIRALDKDLDELNDGRQWLIEDVLRQSAKISKIHNAQISQPVVTAVQLALVDILTSWGILPAAVVGHSSGEIAASYAAHLSSRRDCIVAAYLRGKAVSHNAAKGSMLAVGLGSRDAERYIKSFQSHIVQACHNSPNSVTLSGDSDSIHEVKKDLDADGVFARILSTGGNAYHSHHMKALGQEYEQSMHSFLGSVPHDHVMSPLRKEHGATNVHDVAFFSSVYGALNPGGSLGPAYWRSNLESPVLFDEAVTAMLGSIDIDIVAEIGPHSALQGPLRQIFQAAGLDKIPDYIPAMKRNSDGAIDLLTLAGNMFTKGVNVDLANVNATPSATGDGSLVYGKVVTDLPHYKWQYSDESIILENRYTREWRLRQHPRHDLLGSRIPGGSRDEPTWRNILRSKTLPWLSDHRLGNDMVLPSAAYLSMALEAAMQCIEIDGRVPETIDSFEFRDVTLQNAFIIPEDDAGIEMLFTLRPAALNSTLRYESRYDFRLTSVARESGKDVFVTHCTGSVEVSFDPREHKTSHLLSEFKASSSLHKDVSVSRWYEQFTRVGLCYGPTFRGLSKIHAVGSTNMAAATINPHPTSNLMKNESRYIIHPAALDAALQLLILASHKNTPHTFKKAYMPVGFETIFVWPRNSILANGMTNMIAKGNLKGVRGLSADLTICGSDDLPFLNARNVFFIASDQTPHVIDNRNGPYTRMIWKPEFSQLDDSKIASLHPPVTLDDNAIIPSLNSLALHQLIHFKATNASIFENGSQVPHLQRLLDWTEQKLLLAVKNSFSPAKQIFNYSDAEREAEINRRAALLNPVSSESRLMCHLYANLPAIYNGEKTGIQVALQDNLLIENYEYGQVYKEGNRRLARVIDLLAHEKPGLRILEIGAGTGSATKEILPALSGHTLWRRYEEYRFTDTTPSFLADAEAKLSKYLGLTYGVFDMEKPADAQGYQAEWDLVIASNVVHATSNIRNTLMNVRSALKPGGRMILLELTQSQLSAGLVLGTFSDFWKGDLDPEFPRRDGPFLGKDMWRSVLPQAGFSGLDFHLDDYAGDNISATVICATAIQVKERVDSGVDYSQLGMTLIHRDQPTKFVLGMADYLTSLGFTIEIISISSMKSIPHTRILFLLEVESPFFTDATPAEFAGFQKYVQSAQSALWISAGNLLDGREPAFAMISGVVRGLRTEMSQLRLGTLDLENKPSTADVSIFKDIAEAESRLANGSVTEDSEFRMKNGLLYISRLVADDALNTQSRDITEQTLSTQEKSLRELRSTPIRVDIDKPGVLSTLYFREDEEFSHPLPDDCVEIETRFAGVNNKDIAVVTGRHHSNTFSDECAGRITKVGSSVTQFEPGDEVYCQSFAKFGNFVRDKASFCQKIHPQDSFADSVTMPIAFCTAIYGLMELGRLQKGESVLIQSATGAVGLAAVQIARMCEAEIFVTVGTPEKKSALLSMDYGIAEDHIFGSRDLASASAVLEATNGRGVDVILCSARGQLMHEYWTCIAPCGRFIEIGRTEVLDSGKLNLDVFRRNALFASFDLEVLSKDSPATIARLMSKIHEFRSLGHIRPLPFYTFHVAEIDKALATFSKGNHIGKIILSYEHEPEMGIKFRKSPFHASFDPEATYLLVGCLGGLGRSFSDWAVSRGARKLTYLSRSGANTAEAQRFLESLRLRGVTTNIIQGDVSRLEDVEAAVAACISPIKGVVQGALTLHDGLFESMSLDQFNATLNSRVHGTVNLHRALLNSPLDFFQMWSSWTVMFGTATQSNYLASNAFMDAFARYRQKLGLPATSLSLSQVLGVGIVSYMPEYQQAMIRNGFYGNNEDEFLQYCQAGVCSPPSPSQDIFTYDPESQGHLLVGIEPAGLDTVDKTYPLQDMVWASDPRFSLLIHATRMLSVATSETKALDESENGTVAEQVRLRISRLLYVPVEDVDTGTPINAYGIDSMVAAELRNWLFTRFGKDVSLLNLLGATMTIDKLAETLGSEGEK